MQNFTRIAITTIAIYVSLASFAEGTTLITGVETLGGQYAFNWFNNPSREKCRVIDEKLLNDIKTKYSCDFSGLSHSAAGKSHAVCTSKDKKKELLIFTTKALCDEERETQISNGD